MKRIMVGWLLAVVVGMVSAATYEEAFTPKAGKAYNEDINVWVYTSAFAERFGMPKEWMDDELKGAYAVAYRVVTTPFRTCFLSGDPNKCMSNRECMLDVYIPENAKLPWIDDRPMARLHDYDSARYVLPQTPDDRAWWWRPVGIESPGKKARAPLLQLNGGTLFLREYDKELYPGVTYISFNMGCMEPPKHAALVEFCADEPWEGRRCHALHEIHIPDAYMQKLHGQWHEKTGKDAAKRWREIIGK